MANIQFSSPRAAERFQKMCDETRFLGEKSLRAVTSGFLTWNPMDATIYIGCDFDECSFTFRETYADGRTGICGGIIFHGSRDGFGSGKGPTFSVSLDKTEGYQIHT